MQFTERTPIEEGFAEVFDEKIQPILEKLEADRRAALRKAYFGMALTIPGALAVFGVIYFIWGPDPAFRLSPLLVIFAGVGAWSIFGTTKDKWANDIEAAIMPTICAHVRDLDFNTLGTGFHLGAMRDMNLLPKHDKAVRTSHLRGSYHSTRYEMVHAKLTETSTDTENRRRTSTVFTGLLFRFDVPIRTPGRIVMMRDRGGLGNKLAETFSFGGTRSLPKVTFDNSAFEAAFEVYAEQPEKAKDFMPDAFLDALLRIGKEQGQGLDAWAFVAGFEEDSFYMALKRHGGVIKIGKLTSPITDIEEDLHGVFEDISISHRIIDRLHGV